MNSIRIRFINFPFSSLKATINQNRCFHRCELVMWRWHCRYTYTHSSGFSFDLFAFIWTKPKWSFFESYLHPYQSDINNNNRRFCIWLNHSHRIFSLCVCKSHSMWLDSLLNIWMAKSRRSTSHFHRHGNVINIIVKVDWAALHQIWIECEREMLFRHAIMSIDAKWRHSTYNQFETEL